MEEQPDAVPTPDRKRKMGDERRMDLGPDDAGPQLECAASGLILPREAQGGDTDSDHRGRKVVKSSEGRERTEDGEDEDDVDSSTSSSPPESGRESMEDDEERLAGDANEEDGKEEGSCPQLHDNVDHRVSDNHASVRDCSAPTSADSHSSNSSSSSSCPSPPPLPLHRHRPSSGARRTFRNLSSASDPSSTHRCTVIAAVLVFDGEGRVLLVQEAKPKCRGRWYLPAGRVEVGESPLEGAMREVEEESGLQLDPSGIFSVEYKISKSSGKAWIRYGVTGQIVGGSLKTPEREDKESIQAQWFRLEDVTASLGLRNDDMLKLIALHQQNGDRPVPVLSSYK